MFICVLFNAGTTGNLFPFHLSVFQKFMYVSSDYAVVFLCSVVEEFKKL